MTKMKSCQAIILKSIYNATYLLVAFSFRKTYSFRNTYIWKD